MKAKNILYITDNKLYLYNYKKDNIIKYKIGNNIVNGGRIVNPDKFIKAYEKLIQDNHLNNSLFGETIKIIINSNNNASDIVLLKNIFASFNYRHTYIENETKYYKLNTSNAYLNIFDNYVILTFQNEYKKTESFVIYTNLFLNTDDLMEYLKYRLNDRELYLLGDGDTLNYIFDNFEEKFGNKTYIFSNNEVYLISKAKSK